MMFDYSKLRGKIREQYGTEAKFAKALDISRTSLSQRLNNLLEFSQKEMELSSKLLNFPLNEISDYFFKVKVQKHELK